LGVAGTLAGENKRSRCIFTIDPVKESKNFVQVLAINTEKYVDSTIHSAG
jgi:hypothetical protein